MDGRTAGQKSRPSWSDYLSLWALQLAKLRRRILGSANERQAFYEEFFEAKDIEAYDQDPRMAVRRETVNRCLQEYVDPGASILDVGCGLGDVLAGLPDGYRLYGLDFAAHNVRVAGLRLANRATILQGSIYNLPFRTASMDVCLCLEVLEHIEDDGRAIREIARVLKPHGFLIAAVPYTYYWPQYLALMGHYRHYNRGSFSDALTSRGFTIEAHLPNYPHWHQKFSLRYTVIRGLSLTLGRIGLGTSTYDFKWPGHQRTAIKRLRDQLEPLQMQEASQDYSTKSTSTFLLAKKL